MSRIYRQGMAGEQPNIRTIEIRDLMPKVAELEEFVPDLSMDQLLSERETLLTEAHDKIEQERRAFEVMRDEKLAELDRLKMQWEEEKIQLQQQAYDEGFAQGVEEGRQKAFENMANDIAVANNTMAQAEQNATAYLESQEAVILELAIQSAGRILKNVLAEQKEQFVPIVQRALKEVRDSEFVKIYVSLANYELLTANRKELVAIFPPDMPFMIFIEEELQDTECYIDTNHGRLIASVDEQLNELRRHLGEVLENAE